MERVKVMNTADFVFHLFFSFVSLVRPFSVTVKFGCQGRQLRHPFDSLTIAPEGQAIQVLICPVTGESSVTQHLWWTDTLVSSHG